MSNKYKEGLKFIISVLILCLSFVFIAGYKVLTNIEIIALLFFYSYVCYIFINSLIYIFRFLVYPTSIEIVDYQIENKEKYNKMGKYYLNRIVIKNNNKKVKGNWSIDFKIKENTKIPITCKTNGSHMIIL